MDVQRLSQTSRMAFPAACLRRPACPLGICSRFARRAGLLAPPSPVEPAASRPESAPNV